MITKNLMTIKSAVVLIFTGLITLASCSKEGLNSNPTTAIIDTSLNNLTFVSNPKNLNIVMFVPTDNPALNDYKPRLSQLLVYFQSWFHNEMKRYGFQKYLGLPKDLETGLVNIIEIPAAGKQEDYPYSSAVSANKIINEIKAYRILHPEKFSSENHYLILLPQRTSGDTGQPFYGYGRYCFALDNQFMSVNHIPNPNSNYLGGMLHELGHGLNLPHNRAKYNSEAQQLGTSLMGSGNVSFSKGEPTFLTEVDAAILNVNEVFQNQENANPVYINPTFSIEPNFQIDQTNQKLNITGTFTSNLEVNDILAYMDPNVNNEGIGVNKDYNAVAWRFNPGPNNTISASLGLHELFFKGETPYEVKVKLLLKNGISTSKTFDFIYKNDQLTSLENVAFTYSNSTYSGTKGTLEVGNFTTADLVSKGIADNSISSIKIGQNIKVTLYDGDNFIGSNVVLNSSSTFLSNFNDRTSSIKIELK